MAEYKTFTVRIPEQFIDFTVPVYEDETIDSPMVKLDVFDKAMDQYIEGTFEVYDEHGFQYAPIDIEDADVVEGSESGIKNAGTPSFVTGPGTKPGV